jgi:hypothetical protein
MKWAWLKRPSPSSPPPSKESVDLSSLAHSSGDHDICRGEVHLGLLQWLQPWCGCTEKHTLVPILYLTGIGRNVLREAVLIGISNWKSPVWDIIFFIFKMSMHMQKKTTKIYTTRISPSGQFFSPLLVLHACTLFQYMDVTRSLC